MSFIILSGFPTLYVFTVCFVDIDIIVRHHVLNSLFIITSHIESLNIKRNIDKKYSCFVRYNMENRINLIPTDE